MHELLNSPAFQVIDIGGKRLLEAGERNFRKVGRAGSVVGATREIRFRKEVTNQKSLEPPETNRPH